MRALAWLGGVAVAVTLLAPTGSSQLPADTAGVRDLPLIELPARGDGTTLAIFLSGDGGWASIDRGIAAQLAGRGVSVVGVNLRSYLGTERTPEETASDVARVIRTYRIRWKRDRIAIVGFSRGANLAPFVVARLPEDIRPNVTLMALIGLARHANFKWHLQDVFRDVTRPTDRLVLPELERTRGVRTICIFGTDEKESGCLEAPLGVTRIVRPGGHHLDGDYKAVGDLVADAIDG